MTAEETRKWHEGSPEQQRELLQQLAERVMCEAVDHGHDRYVIYDYDGAVIARGKLRGDIRLALESFRRSQNRLN